MHYGEGKGTMPPSPSGLKGSALDDSFDSMSFLTQPTSVFSIRYIFFQTATTTTSTFITVWFLEYTKQYEFAKWVREEISLQRCVVNKKFYNEAFGLNVITRKTDIIQISLIKHAVFRRKGSFLPSSDSEPYSEQRCTDLTSALKIRCRFWKLNIIFVRWNQGTLYTTISN